MSTSPALKEILANGESYSAVIAEANKRGDALARGKTLPMEGDFEIPADPPKKRGRRKKEEPAIGHNSDIDPALVVAFIWQMMAFDFEEASVRGKRRAAIKQAKEMGIDVKSAKERLKELRSSPDEIAEKHNTDNLYRHFVSLPAADEMILESSITDEKFRPDIALLEGKRAAFRGADHTANPHQSGSPCWQSWVDGFQEASALVQEAVNASVMARVHKSAREASEGSQ